MVNFWSDYRPDENKNITLLYSCALLSVIKLVNKNFSNFQTCNLLILYLSCKACEMIAELFLPCFIVQYMTSIYRLICLFDKIRGFDVSSWKLTQGEKEEIAINVIAHFIMCRLLVGKCCTKIKGFTVTIRWIDKNPHNTCYKRFMVVGENAPWKNVKIFVSQQKGQFSGWKPLLLHCDLRYS